MHPFMTQKPVFVLLANESVNVQKYHVWMTAIINQHIGNITHF